MLRARNRSTPGDDNDEDPEPDRSHDKKSLTGKKTNSDGSFGETLRSIGHQWSLLSRYSQVALTLILVGFTLHIILGTLDLCFQHYGLGPHPSLLTAASSKNTNTNFAVVINTYKRPDMLRDAIRHYALNCGPTFGVQQVVVVWAELKVAPPDVQSFFDETRQRMRAPVQFRRVQKDSLNSRFEPISSLKTEAIFMVDDDVRIECSSLHRGYQAWMSSPDAMVGYYPRLALKSTASEEWLYHSWPRVFFQQRFNFVLTKAAFLHAKYLAMYSDPRQHPTEILDLVDRHMNCEDVAMSMLVANVTRSEESPLFPIFVEGSVSDKGLFGGISTGSSHFATRSLCLTDLTQIYVKHGWRVPFEETVSLLERSWVHHSPGFWWQARPSNVFEWFAFKNLFS